MQMLTNEAANYKHSAVSLDHMSTQALPSIGREYECKFLDKCIKLNYHDYFKRMSRDAHTSYDYALGSDYTMFILASEVSTGRSR